VIFDHSFQIGSGRTLSLIFRHSRPSRLLKNL